MIGLSLSKVSRVGGVSPSIVIRSIATSTLASFPTSFSSSPTFDGTATSPSPSYFSEHQQSLSDPEGFWDAKAQSIEWFKKYDRVLDTSAGKYRWFTGGETNTCFNAIDRHVRDGRGKDTALVYDSPVTNTTYSLTFQELLNKVSHFAGVLTNKGVEKGDRVLIYMPMIPEAAVAMLACARIGAVHTVVFGGFASDQLARRIDHATPKLIVSASCGVEPTRIVPYQKLLIEGMNLAKHTPTCNIVYQRKNVEDNPRVELRCGIDCDWDDAMSTSRPMDPIPVASTDPLYILYTSGTTGAPKGIVRDNGGHLVALDYSLDSIFGVGPKDLFFCASDIGWVVGHSYIVYGPLIHGTAAVLFEGKPIGTPDASTYWRMIEQHKVNCLFTAPTAIRAIKKEDPRGISLKGRDLSSLRSFWLAGERTDPDTISWIQNLLGDIPVFDHWWQTETGWPIASNFVGYEKPFPIKPGSCALPVPGYDVQVMDEHGNPSPPHNDHVGEIVIRLPLPPGTLSTLYNADDMYHETYLSKFPGYYQTGDAGMIDRDGYVHILTRTDDVINVAGHRLTTGQMEEVLSATHGVAECAVIAMKDEVKGEIPLGLVVLKSGMQCGGEEMAATCANAIREAIGPVAAYKHTIIVDALPKTKSGKILRKTMRQIVNSEAWEIPVTIEDTHVLERVKTSLSTWMKEHREPNGGITA